MTYDKIFWLWLWRLGPFFIPKFSVFLTRTSSLLILLYLDLLYTIITVWKSWHSCTRKRIMKISLRYNGYIFLYNYRSSKWSLQAQGTEIQINVRLQSLWMMQWFYQVINCSFYNYILVAGKAYYRALHYENFFHDD